MAHKRTLKLVLPTEAVSKVKTVLIISSEYQLLISTTRGN